MKLFTIGYEGINQKQFLSWLRNHNIDIVADVRNYPLSRKKGFSKTALSSLLGKNVALLCYEKDPEACHRNIVANEIKKRDGNGLKITHLGLY